MLTLPPSVPHRGGALTRAFGRAALAALGWRLEGTIPDRPKFVAIVAPHTSNWDFVVGLFVKFALGVEASWLGKHTLFRAPFGALFRRWGGIPVDRSAPHGMVGESVRAFETRPQLVLAIAPEGTRRGAPRWRSGFYHIATGAGVPVLVIALDWGRKVVRLGPAVTPSGDEAGDLRRIRALYEGVQGKRARA